MNTDRLTVFFMATCNFSQFDDPVRSSAAELLMNKPDGGAVAVMSATRKVYASENTELANGTYEAMFGPDAYGHVVAMRPAEALFTFKSGSNGNGVNDQKFFFMGDPTMKLQFPSGYASIDSINQQPLDTSGGLRFHPFLFARSHVSPCPVRFARRGTVSTTRSTAS